MSRTSPFFSEIKLFNYLLSSALLLIAPTSYSQEISSAPTPTTIHILTLASDWYGNISISTKLGTRSLNGTCAYSLETTPQSFDLQKIFYLNAYFLEKNVGVAFNCAATRVRLATGEEDLDEYTLELDNQGMHYVNTSPHDGFIDLRSPIK